MNYYLFDEDLRFNLFGILNSTKFKDEYFFKIKKYNHYIEKQELTNLKNIEFSNNFQEIHELTFSIPFTEIDRIFVNRNGITWEITCEKIY